MKPRAQTTLRIAVSIGKSMPCRLRKERMSMTAITRKVSGMRFVSSAVCSRSVSANVGSPAM